MYGLGRAHLRSVVEVTDDDGCVRRLDICGPEQTIAGGTTRQQMELCRQIGQPIVAGRSVELQLYARYLTPSSR